MRAHFIKTLTIDEGSDYFLGYYFGCIDRATIFCVDMLSCLINDDTTTNSDDDLDARCVTAIDLIPQSIDDLDKPNRQGKLVNCSYSFNYSLTTSGQELYLKRINHSKHHHIPTMEIDGTIRYSPSMDDDSSYTQPVLPPPTVELFSAKFMEKRRWFNVQLKNLRRSTPYVINIKSWETIIKVSNPSANYL